MPLGETITVINKSGKIVSSSKHLVDVLKEARSAYRERKAEIKAVRNADLEEKRARHMLRAATIHDDDVRSHASSRDPRNPHRSRSHYQRAPSERYAPSEYDQRPRRNRSVERGVDGSGHRELLRRHTDMPGQQLEPRRLSRSYSEPHVDMDLAYGDVPPPLPVKRYEDETELRTKMSKLTFLLDEANCVQHSVTATIESLQKNPDALAAVALTLAEISGLVGKMAPGVLAGLKGSFPAVVALLASPQFMIAAGVGVGITIVALGGFKIIKKIKSQKEMEEPLEMEELQAPELSRIELWRRGIADAEAYSMGTTVDGEFITPGASRHLIAEGVLDADDLKSRASRREHKVKSKAPKSTTSRRSSKSKSGKEKSSKKKEPSMLRMLFTH
jgi:hypothetical protein